VVSCADSPQSTTYRTRKLRRLSKRDSYAVCLGEQISSSTFYVTPQPKPSTPNAIDDVAQPHVHAARKREQRLVGKGIVRGVAVVCFACLADSAL
jgi:hypothetical protein